jgi:hypothetical protein
MKKGIKLATVAAVSAASVAALSDASMAWSSARHRHNYPAWPPTIRLYRSNPGTNYYNVCGYGDCACLRARAVASGSQVWWDRYQACAG